MVKLEDSQIWESDKCIVQIQFAGEACFGFKGVIFEKTDKNTLRFNNILFNDKNRLEDFIINLKMKLVKKRIVIRERKNVKK